MAESPETANPVGVDYGEMSHRPDPALDLQFERIVDVPRELIWKGWTEPAYIKKWFTPAPWVTVECEIDLRPGGMFRTVMQSPEGQSFPDAGCYLEIVPHERLVWTNALLPGFRPAPAMDPASGGLHFTGIISLSPVGDATKYSAQVIHPDSESCAKDAAMGFEHGWGLALDQLVAAIKEGEIR